MSQIEGFKELPIINILDKNNVKSEKYHTLFIKEHSIRFKEADKPEGKTLFVLNVPPYMNIDDLNKMFSFIGEISHILLSDKSSKLQTESSQHLTKETMFKFNTAYIIYKEAESIEKVLVIEKIEVNFNLFVTGVEKWKNEYIQKYPKNITSFKKEIDKFMKQYDVEEEKKKEKNKMKADADGWITVPSGINEGFERKESVVHNLEKKIEESNKKKQLLNFYTFQIRESKMKHIVSLREKFEQDKNKINAMKKTRRFKPF